jgi:VWFA-related protein
MFFMAPIFMLLLAGQALAQEVPLFRADVAQVRLDVQVVDAKGRTVKGLTRDDFAVFDEDQPSEIVAFGLDTEPLDLLLLLDVSGSMRRQVQQLAQSARDALDELRDDDEVALMLFARHSEVVHGFTPDLGRVQQDLRQALRWTGLGAGTLLNAALLAGVEVMREREPRGRRAVLCVTDNQGLNYQSPDEAVIQAYLAADTVLNAIVTGSARPPDPSANPDFTAFDVFTIAEQTGGEALSARDAGKVFPELIERIRSRYSLALRAGTGEAGNFRRVRVLLAGPASQKYPGARVRARSGYTLQ